MNKLKINNKIKITPDSVNKILMILKLKESDLRNIVEKFNDKISWGYISVYQKLSEEFIREFQDKVDWSYISNHQKLSEDFRQEMKKYLYR